MEKQPNLLKQARECVLAAWKSGMKARYGSAWGDSGMAARWKASSKLGSCKFVSELVSRLVFMSAG